MDRALHLQDEGEAAGGLVRVDQADYVGVLEPLEQVELLSHAVPPHQLLVHVLDGHSALCAELVATLDDGEATPSGRKTKRRFLMEYIFFLQNALVWFSSILV